MNAKGTCSTYRGIIFEYTQYGFKIDATSKNTKKTTN